MRTLIGGLLNVLWWFVAGWMCSGGFARVGLAVFRRTSFRDHLAGEWAILRAPFRDLDELVERGLP